MRILEASKELEIMKEQYQKYDVNFLTQSADAGGSMPLGGFDTG
jgi:hypothetical protein